MEQNNKEIMNIIWAIVNRGNHAEVKKNKDGTLRVFEVKKNIAVK